MPLPRRPHRASADEVRITRQGSDTAVIEYADASIATTYFTVGAERLATMTDNDILALWNEHIDARDELRAEYDSTCTEIPVGKAQIKYEELSDQWVPRGHIVRCEVLGASGNEDLDETFVSIDGRDLTIREFVRMVGTFGGWGMRIAFVPDDELDEEPVIEVKEPAGE